MHLTALDVQNGCWNEEKQRLSLSGCYSFDIFVAPKRLWHPHTLCPYHVFTFYGHVVVDMADTAVHTFLKRAQSEEQ